MIRLPLYGIWANWIAPLAYLSAQCNTLTNKDTVYEYTGTYPAISGRL